MCNNIEEINIKFDLYHYFESSIGPFKNLSALSIENAQKIMDKIKAENKTFATHRYDGYLERRKELEQIAREIFIKKGGKPIRDVPHYLVVESCDWLKTWYLNGDFIKIPIQEFDLSTVSFTYGDMFPTFGRASIDGKEYRKQVYVYSEIVDLIKKYGLPQIWNKDGRFGPERYIEVQLWSDVPIMKYIK